MSAYNGCHPRCSLGPRADHPGYLGYRCITEDIETLPWPGEDGPSRQAASGTRDRRSPAMSRLWTFIGEAFVEAVWRFDRYFADRLNDPEER